MKYAASTGCFYVSGTDGIPEDAVEISDADYETVRHLSSHYTFKFIGSTLTVIPIEPDSFTDFLPGYLFNVRSTRATILGRVMDIAFVEQIAGHAENVQVALGLRQQLLDITSRPEVLAAIAAQSEADVRSTIKAAYKAMAAGAPEWLRTAFNQVDA